MALDKNSKLSDIVAILQECEGINQKEELKQILTNIGMSVPNNASMADMIILLKESDFNLSDVIQRLQNIVGGLNEISELSSVLNEKNIATSSNDSLEDLILKVKYIKQPTGDAEPGDVIQGKTFSNKDNNDLIGTLDVPQYINQNYKYGLLQQLSYDTLNNTNGDNKYLRILIYDDIALTIANRGGTTDYNSYYVYILNPVTNYKNVLLLQIYTEPINIYLTDISVNFGMTQNNNIQVDFNYKDVSKTIYIDYKQLTSNYSPSNIYVFPTMTVYTYNYDTNKDQVFSLSGNTEYCVSDSSSKTNFSENNGIPNLVNNYLGINIVTCCTGTKICGVITSSLTYINNQSLTTTTASILSSTLTFNKK